MNYEQKYLKYKTKYELAKKNRRNNLKGGMPAGEFELLMNEAVKSIPTISFITELQGKIEQYFQKIVKLNNLVERKNEIIREQKEGIQEYKERITRIMDTEGIAKADEIRTLTQEKDKLVEDLKKTIIERDESAAQLAAALIMVRRYQEGQAGVNKAADATKDKLRQLEIELSKNQELDSEADLPADAELGEGM